MKQFKMWHEFKILILTSVGRKRSKTPGKNSQSSHSGSGGDGPSSLTLSPLASSDDELASDCKAMMITSEENMSPEDKLGDLNHAAARHRIAIRPNNRRTPSRAATNGQPGDEITSPLTPPVSPLKDHKPLTRSASLSSLDLSQIHEECNLLKPKSHSFKTLPSSSLLMIDDKDVNLSPNVIMVRTLPAIVKMPVNKEQQEKFQLSIANWCLANEGLRKSIQSLKPPQGFSLCLSSESLASICSGLLALDSGVADITEVNNEDEKNDELGDDLQDEDISEKIVDEVIEALIEANDENNNSFNEESTVSDENNDDDEEGLMNVNVKERRQYLLDLLNDAKVLKSCAKGAQDKSTMSRLAAKKAAVVKMAVQNLNNLNAKGAINESSNEDIEAETASILAMEASNKVKFMVSKFDGGRAGQPLKTDRN